MPPAPTQYAPVHTTDAVQFTEQVRDWNFEFSQLKPGVFNADGAVLQLEGVNVGRVDINQTLLHQGFAPRGMVAVMIPGAGSGQVFAHAQLIAPGDCVTLSEGAFLEAVTHGHYVDVAIGFNMRACQAQIEALNEGSIGVQAGAIIASPGQARLDEMLGRVSWLMSAAVEQPASLGKRAVRESLSDHMLAGMVNFDSSPTDVDSTTRADRASRRVAVRLARDFIHSRLSEPLRLSELCRHSHLKVRSLEYGFREITGLTPIAYIRSLRLNTVRRKLVHDPRAERKSISEIATDTGFWHLSQFAADYRRLFGETPTETRRRHRAPSPASV